MNNIDENERKTVYYELVKRSNNWTLNNSLRMVV